MQWPQNIIFWLEPIFRSLVGDCWYQAESFEKRSSGCLYSALLTADTTAKMKAGWQHTSAPMDQLYLPGQKKKTAVGVGKKCMHSFSGRSSCSLGFSLRWSMLLAVYISTTIDLFLNTSFFFFCNTFIDSLCKHEKYNYRVTQFRLQERTNQAGRRDHHRKAVTIVVS